MTTQPVQRVLGVIPARIGSTRVPRKMLKDLAGKTLIRRTYERSVAAQKLDALVVATDSDDIEREANSFGARVIRWTSATKNGTEAAAEVTKLFTDFVPDIVVVIWGDGPLYPASVIDDSIECMLTNTVCDAVVPSFKIDPAFVNDPSVGKVVTDNNNRILYLSRSPIPYNKSGESVQYYSATGALVIRRELLEMYGSLPREGLEAVEDVEQLRLIQRGYCVNTLKYDFENREVNTPEDYEAILQLFRKREGLI